MPRRMNSSDWSEGQLSAIVEAYGSRTYPVKYLMSLPEFSCYTRNQVMHKSKLLGVSRRVRFGPGEIEVMERWGGDKSAREIAELISRKFHRQRTETQVAAWLNKRGMSARGDRIGLVELTRLFRVESKTVLKWVRQGKLPDTKRGEGKTCEYRWKPIDIVFFLREHPWELEGRYVDMPWVMALFEEYWSQVDRKRQRFRLKGERLRREADG